MKRIIERIEQRSTELSSAPLFAFLRDDRIDARKRLSFAPCVAHFVMSFADLYGLVLKEEPARDKYQELVNAHTREDENHWRWFLDDLEKIDCNPRVTLTDSLRFVWGDATVHSRLLTYQMCRLGFGVDSIQKLVLVHCIEAAGKVTIERVAPVGVQVGTQLGKRLVYLGQHHFDTEGAHTIEQPQVHEGIEGIEIDPDSLPRLLRVVDESFEYFRAFVDEMLAFAQSERTVAGA